jgi:hypothetical protein
MKFVEPLPFADPDAAARKLVEIAPASKRCRTAASTSSASTRGEARDKAPKARAAVAKYRASVPRFAF